LDQQQIKNSSEPNWNWIGNNSRSNQRQIRIWWETK